MRRLFDMDKRDYDRPRAPYVRHSARCVAIRAGRVAMVHSELYDYYKFPGGGIEPGETNVQAMIRETREEAGLIVRKETIREYGVVPRRQATRRPGYDVFVQDNFYYLCEVMEDRAAQQLDDYEAEERFTLKWVTPEEAICVNRTHDHGPKDQIMLEREARVLEMLKDEGYFG